MLGKRFFQDDGVVVVEGQEDVVNYPKVLDQLVNLGKLTQESASYLRERFFGWGAGGASKIGTVSALLYDLGFERVAGIFDYNERVAIPGLQSRIPEYAFNAIPADDILTKSRGEGREPTYGLLDENLSLRPEFVEETAELFSRVIEKLRGDTKETCGRTTCGRRTFSARLNSPWGSAVRPCPE